MSDQPTPAAPASGAAADRQQLAPAAADALRAHAARSRADADRLAAVLEDIALNGPLGIEDCVDRGQLRDARLAQLVSQRGHVA